MIIPFHTPLDEFIEKILELSRRYTDKQSQKITNLPKEAVQKILRTINQKVHDVDQQVEAAYQKALRLGREFINGSPITIEVESSKIRSAMGTKMKSIPGKIKLKKPGSFTTTEVGCYVAYGHWSKLGELKETRINIVEHLKKLLPSNQSYSIKRPLGLVTFQNGIMNDFDDFKKISDSIIHQFPEGPLCIGLHNPTKNLASDLARFSDELVSNPNSVHSLCQTVKTFADILPTINSDLVWVHFAHSEAGLIANAVFTLCEQFNTAKNCIKQNLVAATYGAVKPIPNNPVLGVVNTYSDQDIALFFGKAYLDTKPEQIKQLPYTSTKIREGKTYEVTLVNSLLPYEPLLKTKTSMIQEQRSRMTWLEFLGCFSGGLGGLVTSYVTPQITNLVNHISYSIDDHGFTEATYREAFKRDVNKFRAKYQIYAPKAFH